MGFVFCALIKKDHFHLEIIGKLRETIFRELFMLTLLH